MANNNDLDRTKERLLNAAAEIFAEHGYAAATVRNICKKADANLAAVNYHFGGKEGLYAEVVKKLSGVIRDKYRAALKSNVNAPPKERLFFLIKSFLTHITEESRPAWHGRIMAREMTEPTVALEKIVKDAFSPFHGQLKAVVKQILPKKSAEQDVDLCIASIIGQCLFYHRGKTTLTKVLPGLSSIHKDVDKLAQHIALFSFAGLNKNSLAVKPKKK